MRKNSSLSILIVLVLGLVPHMSSSAQSEITLATLDVRLWPEYDQPSMLVLYDFALPAAAAYPVRLTFRIPEDANLIAVASMQGSGLVNAPYEGPVKQDGRQTFTIAVASPATYHFEYYQPLEITDTTRRFTYAWDGAYAVDQFSVSVLRPLEALTFSSDPQLKPVSGAQGANELQNDPVALAAGERFVLTLQYEKTSQELAVPPSAVKPARPIDEGTTGRISLNQFLPWVLGGIGFAVVVGGVIYYFLSARPTGRARRRRRSAGSAEESAASIYCPQCGARARTGDQFCRVCGTRLGKKE
jgi:hypothetical protein